ncbi:MAG: TPM domain-containing protein [Ferruginibacter sp.]|nr:TPM domain-containing protein [Chitinophagaceae bacterium]MBP6287510.1 TPM domain-containing protein [Ferruginibacter sp.]MBU9936748.1 TPM domain-containing protein [Ferruginibacter sp.]HQY13017.1 TPM domain-containing protein [Ferruginibacter sp.]
MKKLLSIFIALLVAVVSFSQKKTSPDELLKYKPTQLVNDFTNTLTAAQQQALERKLVAFDDSTTTQIAVVIIATLDGNDIADYNVKLGRAWGVGGKEFSNGVVLLIAKDDRKLNISTGYGVEGALPDITCNQIIEDIIVPNFKGDDYYRGIEEGTDAIIKAVKGEYKAPAEYHKKGKSSVLRIVFIIIIIILFLAMSGGRGGGGSFMSRRGFTAWTIGNILGSMGRSGGGGWSGGGGGSSGGFGGFGGGSFGGGGASGSW